MPTKKRSKRFTSAAMAHLNELLDEALEETFPASDPIAINVDMETSERVITIIEQRGAIAPKVSVRAEASDVERLL